jgi:hypothetical protein
VTLKRKKNPMPAWVRLALNESGLMAKYRARPAYQQNDWVGWIAAPKLEATRQKRLASMLEELDEGTHYMRMKWNGAGAAKTPRKK